MLPLMLAASSAASRRPSSGSGVIPSSRVRMASIETKWGRSYRMVRESLRGSRWRREAAGVPLDVVPAAQGLGTGAAAGWITPMVPCHRC